MYEIGDAVITKDGYLAIIVFCNKKFAEVLYSDGCLDMINTEDIIEKTENNYRNSILKYREVIEELFGHPYNDYLETKYF